MTFVIISLLVLLALLLAIWLYRRRAAEEEIGAPWPIPEPRQHAVVLAHGLLGFDSLKVLGTEQPYFRGIADHLGRHGVGVHTARVPPLASVAERAEQLRAFVEEIDEKRCILIGHSMGGLDSRYALSKLGLHERVNALVSVGTPHRGTVLADAANLLPAKAARSLLGKAGFQTDALDWLGEKPAKHFNREITDVEGVFYGSVVGATNRKKLISSPLLLACYELLLKMRGPNDGLVPADSQVWGREIMTVDADHFGQIGWSPLYDARVLYLSVLEALHLQEIACLPSAYERKLLSAGSQTESTSP